MSFEAMAWATKQKVKSSQKIVLIMLASMADNDKGLCWPKHATLADDCGMSVASLKDQLKELVEAGLIDVIHRSSQGVSLPNVYRVILGGVGQNLAGGGSESGWGVGQNLATDTVSVNQSLKHSLTSRGQEVRTLAEIVEGLAPGIGMDSKTQTEFLTYWLSANAEGTPLWLAQGLKGWSPAARMRSWMARAESGHGKSFDRPGTAQIRETDDERRKRLNDINNRGAPT